MKTVVIDGGKMYDRESAHNYIAERLGFPGYYGKNLDALHDCLCEMGEDVNIVIYRKERLIDSLEHYGEIMLEVFEHAAQDNIHITLAFDGE